MALRGENKNVRKLNRVGFRRKAGRTAEFFDLRETDQSNDNSRPAATASEHRGGSYRYPDRTDDSARPYRERHRVEVNANSQNDYFRYGEDLYGSGYGSGRGSASYGGGQSNGSGQSYGSSQSYSGSRSYSGSQSYSGGRPYDNSRIVRGNTPGSRSGITEGSEEKEISSDLLYSSRDSRRSTDRGGRSSGRYSTGAYNSGTSSSYGGRNSSYGGRNSSYGSGSYSSYSRDRFSSYRDSNAFSDEESYEDPNAFSDEKAYESTYEDTYGEDSYDEAYGRRGLPDEEAADRQAVLGRRLRQRAQGRRQREQELRALYVKIGIGAAVFLLLAIFIFPRIFRSGNSAKVSDGPQAAAQTQENAGTPEGQKETETTAEEVPAEQEAAGQEDTEAQKAAEGTEPEYLNADEDAAAVAEQKDAQTAETGGEQTENKEAAASEQKDTQTAEAGGEQAQNQEAAPAEQKDTQTAEAGGGQTQNQENAAAEDSNSVESTHMTAAESGKYARQDDWHFILVNPWYMLPEGYDEVATSSIPNGESVDSRCYPEFVKMLDDCRAAGGNPVVCSSYRSHAKQVVLFDNQVKDLMAKGMTRQEAEVQAGTEVAVPGTSEHELGLAVDICDYKYQNLDDAQAETVTQKWLIRHCWEYGFILRYPKGKTEITGIIYEPWHYRYVGRDAAKEITEKGICLEEYLEQ